MSHLHIKEGLASKIVKAFTFNRPLSFIILIGVLAFGALSYLMTPKQYNPEIIRPAFSVVTEYPNANAEEVNLFITNELAEKINDIRGVDEIVARSYDGGLSEITVIFDVGENLEDAKVRLYTRLMRFEPFASGKIREPSILAISPDDVPIVTVALYSDTMSQNDVRERAIGIMNKIKEVDNVANVSIHGGESRALSVRVDIGAMRERGISVEDVQRAILRSNVKNNSGSFRDGNELIVIDLDNTISSADDIRSVVISPGVELADIATVEDGWQEKQSFVLFYAKEGPPKKAVYLSVAKRPGSNAPSVSADVRAKLDGVMRDGEYSEIKSVIVRDDGLVAQKEINRLGLNLLQSILIVGVVLVFFLSLRPALVVMTAIPLTLLLVFAVAFVAGETINRITLFALILSLGLLVDSATVVVENVHRHMKKSDNREASVVRAVQQVAMGLVLSTVTSVVVFLPIKYITGMMGPYMGPLSFFVPVALIMALVVAFIITPFLTYTILRSDKEDSGIVGAEKAESGIFEKITAIYARVLRFLLYSTKRQNKLIVLAVIMLVVSIALPATGLVHFQMLPKADKEQYYVYIDMPVGTDIVRTKKTADSIAEVVRGETYTKSLQVFVGEPPVVDFNGMFKGVMGRVGANQATIRVNITEPESRNVASSEIVSKARTAILEKADIDVGTSVKVLEDPPGPPVVATFVAKVFGPNIDKRESIARSIQETVRSIDGAVDIDTSIEEAGPRIRIDIDSDLARAYGVTAESVSRTISFLFGPVNVGQYHANGLSEYAPIELALPKSLRENPEILDDIDVRTINGSLIPLSSIATYKWSRTVPSIVEESQKEVSYVTAEVDGRSIVYVMIDTIKSLLDNGDYSEYISDWNLFGMTYTFPDGETYTVRWGGEWEMTLENFRDLGIAMLVALFLVYGILVAQYSSFRVPALIMSTVPFGLVGILPGFFVLDSTAGIYLTATALIGFIALIGIVVNNAILFMEYFEEIKEKTPDMDNRDALIQAGSTRLRPILLTSLTTVLGSITIASDPVWSGLAWSIVFGLSLSTILTLVIFPVLYIRTQKRTDA